MDKQLSLLDFIAVAAHNGKSVASKSTENKKIEPVKVAKKPTPVFDSLKKSTEPAVVVFSDKAMAKMMGLVMMCGKEVAWHGSTRRLGTGRYIVDDIYLYPQDVSAASVNVTDERYGNWCVEEIMNNIERAEARHFHAHSHVNMATFPSAVDRDYQDDTIEMLADDGYYIFMIVNKGLNCWFKIVDRIDGVYYETCGHNITINTESNGLQEICKEYVEKVNDKPAYKRTYYSQSQPKYNRYYGDYFDDFERDFYGLY